MVRTYQGLPTFSTMTRCAPDVTAACTKAVAFTGSKPKSFATPR